MCGWPLGSAANPAGRFSIVNRSRPRKKGICGYEAGKHVKARKRQILVDTLGLFPCVMVPAASVQDSDGAPQLPQGSRHKCSRLQHMRAAGPYAGRLVDSVKALRPPRPIRLEMTKRSDTIKRFVVIPNRWIVERTFRCLNRYRRLTQDDELLPETTESLMQVTMLHLMIPRLARIAPYQTRS